MTTQPQTDVHVAPISTPTERVLHDFVRDSVLHLSEVLKDSAPDFEDDTRWEHGTDGHFRERKKRIRTLWPMLSDEWLRSLPEYHACVECLKSDLVAGPHLDLLIGTSMPASRLEANNILKSLMYAMLDDEGLAFTDERIHIKWREMVGLFGVGQIAFKTVAPLPYLVVPSFPLRLNNELVRDRLTDDEVTRNYQVGVVRPVKDSHFNRPIAGIGGRRTRVNRASASARTRTFRPCPAQLGAVAGRDRDCAHNRLQVGPPTQVYPARGDSGWSPGPALSEVDRRPWLGGRLR